MDGYDDDDDDDDYDDKDDEVDDISAIIYFQNSRRALLTIKSQNSVVS